jgi:hypothetical protein
VLHGAPPATERHPRRRTGYAAISGTDASNQVGAAVTTHDSQESIESEDTSPGEDDEHEHDRARAGDAVRRQGWTALSFSFIASNVMTLCAYFFPVLFAIPLFGQHLAKEWLWTFTPSLSYVGQGIIMGFPTTASMAAGAVVGWGVLSPLAKNSGWAPGPTGSMTDGARGWILWTALGIMCSDALVGLAPVLWNYATSRLGKRPSGLTEGDDDEEVEAENRLVPMTWVGWGLGISVAVGVTLIWWVFGEAPWATFIGFFAGSLLSVLGYVSLLSESSWAA